ncbi:MAG: ribulose phosphate epimerase [Myxococcota bacterium]
MAYGRTLIVVVAAPLLACGPTLVPTTVDDDGANTTAASTSFGPGSATTTPSPATTVDPSVGETSGDDGLDGTSESTGSAFIMETDIGGVLEQCDPFAQDCPRGEKCTFYSPQGAGGWDWVGCVPIADNPAAPGEECSYEGSPFGGHDDCELGSMCWNVDGKTGLGTCVSICMGSEDNPTCEPGFRCAIAGGPLALCLPTCDPLAQDCGEGQGCYPVSGDWTCAPHASEGEGLGGQGSPCQYVNSCNPGLMCSVFEDVLGCEDPPCCTEVCPLDMPMCEGEEQGVECVPWDDNPPPGYENVGVCAVPAP